MRNLLEYPVTLGEAIATVIAMRDEMETQQVIGDTRPLVLQIVVDLLKEQDPEAFVKRFSLGRV